MHFSKHNQRGFSLIEVIAATVLLGLLLTGAYSVLQESTRQVTRSLITERAAEVARRHMELLLVSRQEPDNTGLENIDEVDPDFSWKIDLKRIPAGDQPRELKTSVIHATFTVKYLGDGNLIDPYELHRFFETLNAKPGNDIAVPFQTAYEMDESFMDILKELGEGATSEDIKRKMSEMSDL